MAKRITAATGALARGHGAAAGGGGRSECGSTRGALRRGAAAGASTELSPARCHPASGQRDGERRGPGAGGGTALPLGAGGAATGGSLSACHGSRRFSATSRRAGAVVESKWGCPGLQHPRRERSITRQPRDKEEIGEGSPPEEGPPLRTGERDKVHTEEK